MKTVIAIAAGGAVGAVARHYVAHYVTTLSGYGFPWGILTVNILGAFVMGLLIEVMAFLWSPSLELRSFLVVGILGSFTTFSTFALDSVTLATRGQLSMAALYVTGSVLGAIAALFIGMQAARYVVS